VVNTPDCLTGMTAANEGQRTPRCSREVPMRTRCSGSKTHCNLATCRQDSQGALPPHVAEPSTPYYFEIPRSSCIDGSASMCYDLTRHHRTIASSTTQPRGRSLGTIHIRSPPKDTERHPQALCPPSPSHAHGRDPPTSSGTQARRYCLLARLQSWQMSSEKVKRYDRVGGSVHPRQPRTLRGLPHL
jgi:hypothetical protein